MTSRREFLGYATTAAASAISVTAVDARNVAQAPKEATRKKDRNTYTPVRTLNGWSLPYVMKNGVKEFHIVAEEIDHEFAPGSRAKCWGYNGSYTRSDHRSRRR